MPELVASAELDRIQMAQFQQRPMAHPAWAVTRRSVGQRLETAKLLGLRCTEGAIRAQRPGTAMTKAMIEDGNRPGAEEPCELLEG